MTLILHDHPFAAYCWKALIALYERGVPFEARQVDGEEGRVRLSELWPPASIPVLVDDEAGLVLPESTTVVEYVDRFGDAPPLIPAEPAAALQARLWDRIVDGHVMTPMQKVVLNALRGEGRGDPVGVEDARAELGRVYELLDRQLDGSGLARGRPVHAGRLRGRAGAALRPHGGALGRAAARVPDRATTRGSCAGRRWPG